MKRIPLVLAILLVSTALFADVRLPKIFGDNMVLQRGQPIVVWGWSSPREKITVMLNKQTKTVTASKEGKWKLVLDAMQAGGPHQLVVRGKNIITFNNVLIGEVWICSGQSNMEWSVRLSKDAETEIPSADYPRIRHIKIPSTIAAEPQDDIAQAPWEICSPKTVPEFTAVGYFFARELNKDLDIPVGLINTSWGGTHVETWISKEAFEQDDEFRRMIASMGMINLDSMQKKNAEAVVKRIEGLQGPIIKSAQMAQQWKDFSFDDSSWPKMKVPGFWEGQGLGQIDGVLWMRKTFSVNGNAGSEAVVSLGLIDDADETFVNGVRVGGLKDYTVKRTYTVPAGLLREGKNVVAVRIDDTAGSGGFYGEPGDVKISFDNKSQSLTGDWTYQVESLVESNSDVTPNQFPTLLFNSMINPLIPYTIRGALWYQGESNARRAYQYRKAFPLMINDWRKRWGKGDFPFYFVQLASFNYANGDNSNVGSAWAELREAQALTLALPNTGMVVTTDIGDSIDIHPRNKQEVGHRLAAIAKHDVHKQDIISGGPMYQSMKKEGNKIVLNFTDTGSGLMVKDKYGYVKGFEIAGQDRKFHFAQAQIEGNSVVVYHQAVADPVSVRYGWADDASDCNVFNKEGFPAAPFRTDNWKGITEDGKFRVGLIFQ
jgi:sialate O-acetylesterase